MGKRCRGRERQLQAWAMAEVAVAADSGAPMEVEASLLEKTPEKNIKKEKKEKSEKKNSDTKMEKDDKVGSLQLQKQQPNANLDQRKLFKEGQKNLTPPVADATRGFYSSLLDENPNSKIAIKYAIEYGLLAVDEHTKLLKKYNKMKDAGAFNVSKMMKLELEKKADKVEKQK